MKALIIGLLAMASVSQAKPSAGFMMFLPGGQVKASPNAEALDQAMQNAPKPGNFKMLLPGGQLRESPKAEALDQAVQSAPKHGGFKMSLPGGQLRESPKVKTLNQAVQSAPKPGVFKMILPGGQVQESQKSERVESGPKSKTFQMKLPSGGVRSDKSVAKDSLKKDFFQLFPLADDAEQVSRVKRDAANSAGFHMYHSDMENAKALPGAVPFLPRHPGRRRRRRRSITQTEKPAVDDSLTKDLPDLNLQVYQEAEESGGCGCGTPKDKCTCGN